MRRPVPKAEQPATGLITHTLYRRSATIAATCAVLVVPVGHGVLGIVGDHEPGGVPTVGRLDADAGLGGIRIADHFGRDLRGDGQEDQLLSARIDQLMGQVSVAGQHDDVVIGFTSWMSPPCRSTPEPLM